jgi:hypothetical protein
LADWGFVDFLGLTIDDEGYCDWFPVLIQSKDNIRQAPSPPATTTEQHPVGNLNNNDFLRENRCH